MAKHMNDDIKKKLQEKLNDASEKRNNADEEDFHWFDGRMFAFKEALEIVESSKDEQ